MNTRKMAYLFLGLGFVLLISGGFSSFLVGLKADHQQVLRRMDDVSGVFESFSTNTTIFEDFREQLYGDVLENVYYDTMFQMDKDVKSKFEEYEGIVDDIKKDAKKLDDLCQEVYYPQADANNKCSNYKSIYEQVVNYFVGDVESYNENVTKYNEYQLAIQSDKIIDEYSTKKKYIDYNGDKIFDGKEE